jgi:hypothetical protein
MPARKPQTPRPLEDPAEYQRFLDMAKEVEADETPGALDRAFDKVVKPKHPMGSQSPKKR